MPDHVSGGPSHLPEQDRTQSAPEVRERAATAGDPPDTGHGVLTAGSESSGLEEGQASNHHQAGQSDGPQPQGRNHYDPRYLSWREQQLRMLDAEYDEFHREHQDRFDAEFDSWRQSRREKQNVGAEANNQDDTPQVS